MAPPTALRSNQSTGNVYAEGDDDERAVREGLEASARGEAIELTAEELAEYGATGVLPVRVDRWLTSRG